MSEATRLKMTGGHFIWIWADTSSVTEFFQPYDMVKPPYEDEDYRQQQQQKVDSKYYQQPSLSSNGGGGGRKQNQTHNKSINSNRYHHIIGLHETISRDKRGQIKAVDEDIGGDASTESDKVNIKSINSNEFNGDYYVKSESNIFNAPSDFDDSSSSSSNDYGDYNERINPYSSKMDLDKYSEATNDSKAKRADNFMQSTFNISSHVFFHHFKDFPVGLLALRHIKMNVDRVFVRSAIRLFASTWARVEKNEEIRLIISGGGSGKTTLMSRDFDDFKKLRNNQKVNNRYSNNVRGNNNKKFKRDVTQDKSATSFTFSSRPPSVNISINFNNSLSGLTANNLTNGDTDKSNISNNKVTSKNFLNNSHQKRSWWSPNSNQQQSSTQQQRARAQEKARILGTPQYRGGCFGSPNRSEIKRSEIFARLSMIFINLFITFCKQVLSIDIFVKLFH